VEPNWLEFWYSALGADHGVCIETDDPQRAKMKLYAARAAANDESLSKLSVVQSPTNALHLWIIHKETPNAS
jgi:hypothetical protein